MDDRLPQLDESLDRIGRWSCFFKGQALHLLLLALCLAVTWAVALPALPGGEWLGLSARTWLALAIGVPVLHQVVVALSWRAQLCWQVYTRLFGERDTRVWAVVFLPLLAARPLVLLGLGLADTASLQLPYTVSLPLGLVLLVPALYGAYSVKRWFGIDRALGGDHFRERYRHMPRVREGAFAWTPNAMYVLVFLGVWAIALLTRSQLALAAALFHHAYIHVHLVCTEQPDMDLLYGSD